MNAFFSISHSKITNTSALTTSSTQDRTGCATSLCLEKPFPVPNGSKHSQERDTDLSPAFSSTVSTGVIHPKQKLGAGFTNLCSAPSIQREMQRCTGQRRITGMKRYRHFNPWGGESVVKLYRKPAQTSRGQELLARATDKGSPFCSTRPRALTLCFHCYGSGTLPC